MYSTGRLSDGCEVAVAVAEEELDEEDDELCSIGRRCSVSLLSTVSLILMDSDGGFGVSLSSLSYLFLY